MEGAFFFVIFFIIFFACIITSAKKATQKSKTYYVPPSVPITTQPQRPPEAEIKNMIMQHNPNFSEDSFKRFCEMVYIRYLASIMKQDSVDVKGYLHRQLFDAHNSYIETIKLAGRHIQIENIVVSNMRFIDYGINNNIETLRIELHSKMNQYETDNNGLVISGYRSRIVSKTEVLTFQRDNNKLHKSDIIKCANCMATLPSVATVCTYCGAAVKFNDKTNDGWLLSDVRTL